MIFTVAILIYFQFSTSFSFESENHLDLVLRDGKIVSSSLITRGYPGNWTSENVTKIGITNGDYRLNVSKLHEFKNIDYNESKRIFSINSEYFVYFSKNGAKQTIDGIEDIGVNGTDYETLVAISRVVFWNGSFYEMRIHTWQ